MLDDNIPYAIGSSYPRSSRCKIGMESQSGASMEFEGMEGSIAESGNLDESDVARINQFDGVYEGHGSICSGCGVPGCGESGMSTCGIVGRGAPQLGVTYTCDTPNYANRMDVYDFLADDTEDLNYLRGYSEYSRGQGTIFSEPADDYELESGEIAPGQTYTIPISDEKFAHNGPCDSRCLCQFDPSMSYSPIMTSPGGPATVRKATRVSDLKPSTFESPPYSWRRVFEKYSPSTELFHSPIKPAQTNLYPYAAVDIHLYGAIWVLSMSEQFYYDNAILLLHNYRDDQDLLKEVLRFNFQLVDAEDVARTMVDVNILGSGSFGDVYRVRKEGTNEFYAIKYLKKAGSGFFEHTHSLLEYIKEKNFLIRARNSPYVVQFFSSLKFPNVGGLFLFFEWCLSDLRKYVTLVSLKADFYNITRNLYKGVDDSIDQVLIDVYNSFDFELYRTTIVYVFEVFCIIDYLAKCNIVHQDLKPENIMIGRNLHLKVGDFGLSYNTKFITRPTQVYLVEVSKINAVESSNLQPRYGGTALYEDMEQCFRSIQLHNYWGFNRIMNDPDRLPDELPFNPKDADPEFLSDLWATGLIATELMLGGVHFLDPYYIPYDVRSAMRISDDIRLAIVEITYIKSNYERYVQNGLTQFARTDFYDLMEFLASIFQPRPRRAAEFVKEKTVYRYKTTITLKYIDINKVEQIEAFDSIGLRHFNAFLYNLPLELGAFLSKTLDPQFATLKQLLETKIKTDENQFFGLEPGIQTSVL